MAEAVLLTPDFLRHCTDYQDGTYYDLISLLRLRVKTSWHSYEFVEDEVPIVLESLHSIFDPWYRSGLGLLRMKYIGESKRCRSLREIVAMEAAAYGRLTALQTMPNLLEVFCPLIDLAVYGRQIEVLDYLLQIGCHRCTPHAINWAAMHGEVEWINQLQAKYNRGCTGFALHNAAVGNNMQLAQFLHSNITRDCLSSTLLEVVRRGHLDMAVWLIDVSPNNIEVSCRLMDVAAMNGHLEVVKWLHSSINCGCTKDAMNLAAMNGHLEMVQWLHENRIEGCSVAAMNWAIAMNHFDVVKWLHENRSEGCSPVALLRAIERKDWKVVSWLLEFHNEKVICPVKSGSAITTRAALNGNLNVLQWLHENLDIDWSTDVMDEAAASGNMEMVLWLNANRKEGCSKSAISRALHNHHWKIVNFLHERVPFTDHYPILSAIDRNDIDVLDWLHRHCPDIWDSEVKEYAARYGHFVFVEWLDFHRQEAWTAEALESAIFMGKYDIATFLYKKYNLKCRSLFMPILAEKNRLNALKFVNSNQGENWTTEVMDRGVLGGNLELLGWLRDNRPEGCTMKAYENAISRRDQRIVTWLEQKFPYLFECEAERVPLRRHLSQ